MPYLEQIIIKWFLWDANNSGCLIKCKLLDTTFSIIHTIVIPSPFINLFNNFAYFSFFCPSSSSMRLSNVHVILSFWIRSLVWKCLINHKLVIVVWDINSFNNNDILAILLIHILRDKLIIFCISAPAKFITIKFWIKIRNAIL